MSATSAQLTLALSHLREIRAVFKDQLKREPASDWFQDVADVLDHPGISDPDRLRVALALLATARAALPASASLDSGLSALDSSAAPIASSPSPLA
jgi:hypothetical protein